MESESGLAPPGSFAPALQGANDRAPPTPKWSVSERAEMAKLIHSSRRSRDNYFPSNLFADPAWDILLILYWASYAQQHLTISNVCDSAGVPATTAVRWIDSLKSHGLLRKTKHPTDGRVVWIDLTQTACEQLDRFFNGVLEAQAEKVLPHTTQHESAEAIC